MKNEFLEYESEHDRLEPADIEFGLRHLPGMIGRQTMIAAEKRKEVELARLRFKIAKAKAIIRSHEGKRTATDKIALADIATEPEAMALLEAETKHQIEVIKAETLQDKFNSVRKQANLIIIDKEMMHDSITKKYSEKIEP